MTFGSPALCRWPGRRASGLTAAILCVVLMGCAGAAKPSSTNSDRAPAAGQLEVAAGYLGLSAPRLRARLQLGETLEQVADSSPGHSAAGLQAAMLAAQRTALEREGLSPAVVHRRLQSASRRLRRQLHRSRHGGGDLALAARYLGTDPDSLAAQLGTGHSLDQIAASTPGRSVAGLSAALLQPRASLLQAALREHQITKAQEQTALATLHTRVDRELAGSA